GNLRVNGSIATSSGVTINAGGTLSGTGTVSAIAINSGGTINAGASPGTLTAGAMTWNAGGSDVEEINDFAGSAGNNPGWDLINAPSLNITGSFTVKLTSLSGTVAGN